jgi:hypothetical protein
MIGRLTSLISAAVLIVAGGAIHGDLTNRWGLSPDLRHAVDVLPSLPKSIGEWQGSDVPPTDDQLRQFDGGEIEGWVMRRYVQRSTGVIVSVLVVCGTPGPIIGHSPETCYGGGGFVMSDQPVRGNMSEPGSREHTFLSADFRKPSSVTPAGLKFYWSWRGGDRWEVPDRPRTALAPYRTLHKIYVVREMTMPDASIVEDKVTPSFIRALLPAMESTILAKPGANHDPRA